MKTTTRKPVRNGHALSTDWLKIKNAFSDTAVDAKDMSGEMLRQSVSGAKKKAIKLQNNVANYTSKKPLKTLGIAMLTGVVLGYFLKK